MHARLLLATVILGFWDTEARPDFKFSEPKDLKCLTAAVTNNPDVIFNVTSVKSTKQDPASASIPEMRCTVRKDRNVPPLTGAVFWHVKSRKELTAATDKHDGIDSGKAVLGQRKITVQEIGEYRCEFYSNERCYAFATFSVKARPVFHMNRSRSLKEYDAVPNTAFGPKITVRVGETAYFHCPAIAYPEPTYAWYKDVKGGTKVKRSCPRCGGSTRIYDSTGAAKMGADKRIKKYSNGTLELKNVTKADAEFYYCVAQNSFQVKGVPTTFNATLVYELEVMGKPFGPYDWITPMAIIVVMVILLIAIIYGCSIVQRYRGHNVVKTSEPVQARQENRNLRS